MTQDEVVVLASNLAKNVGFCVFPCLENKAPACPQGFKAASRDPAAITDLWSRYPGPLIGVATGTASGIDVLDVDPDRGDEPCGWWHENVGRMPLTRAYRTRRGGVHLLFVHADGVGCSAGKLAPGIDVRGDGGYCVSWFAAGFECLDHSPPTPWPAWLLSALRTRPARDTRLRSTPESDVDRAIEGVLRVASQAAEGERNSALHWSACRLGERVRVGQVSAGQAENLLIAAGVAAGLPEQEARVTARSGLRRAAA